MMTPANLALLANLELDQALWVKVVAVVVMVLTIVLSRMNYTRRRAPGVAAVGVFYALGRCPDVPPATGAGVWCVGRCFLVLFLFPGSLPANLIPRPLAAGCSLKIRVGRWLERKAAV